MRKTYKILSVVLAVLMVFSIMPITASAATYSGTCGDNATWIFNASTGTLTISGTGAMYDYDFGNCPWESYTWDHINKVIVSNGITTIGDWAFAACYNLTSVTIPDSVTTIGAYAFCSCESLASVTLPDSLTIIEDRAFNSCFILTNVIIPDSVTTIGDYSFAGCHGMESIIIGDSVTTIGEGAFYNSGSFATITIPDSVTTIGDYAFCGCTFLKSITVESNNQYYSSDEYGVLFNKDKATLIQYPLGNTRSNYTIPDSVTTIGEYAFQHCYSLENVTIGNSVTVIGDYAFEVCYNLTDVYYGGTETQWKNLSIGSNNEELLSATIHYMICEHKFEDWYTIMEPTCEEAGTEVSYCTNCNIMETRNIPALNHNFEEEFTVDEIATWDGDVGWMSRHCTKCDATIDGRPIHDDTHTMSTEWEEFSFDFPIACAGTYVLHCLDCDYGIKKQDSMHSREFWYEIPATCTTDGYGVMCCAVCWNELGEREIYPATGHDWSDWEREEPTCTEDGYEGRWCPGCSELERIILPATGHDYATEYTVDIEPTCTSEGSKSQHCSKCDSKQNATEIPMTPHNLTWYTLSVVGCETDGVEHGYCKHCDYLEVKTTSKTGHNYPTEFTVDVEPTCTTDGVRSKHCSRCDSRIVITTIPATGHNYSAWSTVTAPTCTTDGSEQRTCLNCSRTETKTIDKLNHNYSIDFTVDVEPTCTTDGVKSKHCARCDSRIVITAIPATGHKHEAVITAPTCEEQGYTTYTCECGDSYVDDYVDALGHADNDGNGYCDACNKNLSNTAECSCNCHKSGISKFFFDFMLFFQRIFGSNKECACGVAHY